MLKVTEGHELDNVSEDGFSFGRAQNAVIAIQHLHITEVCVAYSHNDNGHGEVGGVYDGLPRVRHVCYNSICQDQQNEILLVREKEGVVQHTSQLNPDHTARQFHLLNSVHITLNTA